MKVASHGVCVCRQKDKGRLQKSISEIEIICICFPQLFWPSPPLQWVLSRSRIYCRFISYWRRQSLCRLTDANAVSGQLNFIFAFAADFNFCLFAHLNDNWSPGNLDVFITCCCCRFLPTPHCLIKHLRAILRFFLWFKTKNFLPFITSYWEKMIKDSQRYAPFTCSG